MTPLLPAWGRWVFSALDLQLRVKAGPFSTSTMRPAQCNTNITLSWLDFTYCCRTLQSSSLHSNSLSDHAQIYIVYDMTVCFCTARTEKLLYLSRSFSPWSEPTIHPQGTADFFTWLWLNSHFHSLLCWFYILLSFGLSAGSSPALLTVSISHCETLMNSRFGIQTLFYFKGHSQDFF